MPLKVRDRRADPLDPIVIVAARRTPIGRFLGALQAFTAVDLAVVAAEAAMRDVLSAVDPDRAGSVPVTAPRAGLAHAFPSVEGLPRIDRVVLGCARQAGVGPNPARQLAVRAGFGATTVAATVNMACGSGLEAILDAARIVRLHEADWVLAAGVEAMSRIPFLLDRYRAGYRMGHAEVVDAMYRDGYLCPLAGQLMGETAETLARDHAISREDQDRYALESHRRAVAARDEGRFDAEIVPVPLAAASAATSGTAATSRTASALRRPADSADAWALLHDEHPREDVTLERLASLPPVFAEGGTVTAGNASGITDGAAALVVTRASEAERFGIPPLARLITWESAGVEPENMGMAPVPAIRTLFDRERLDPAGVDLVEVNEAFAVQVLAVARELNLRPERLNVNGGAIALGHPTGCSGARITTTLLHEMRRRGARRGLAALCVSGGLGVTALFERMDGVNGSTRRTG